MKSVLVLYYSRGGHTARISRAIAEKIEGTGNKCTVMHISEATTDGLSWPQYDCVALGACVLYGSYDKSVFAFATEHQTALDSIPNSFYSVNVAARKPEKRIPENNKYLQKFIELSPWKPKDVKVIAGELDYPSWRWWDRLAIQMIMKMTGGPTDTKSVIDYTDWDDVKAYADHLVSLAK